MPSSALKCIESWKKFLPGYELVRWDEAKIDVNAIPYASEAYKARRYAFVSDWARLKILYEEGGLYFDTDVELIKPLDHIIAAGPFMGQESDPLARYGRLNVAPGLGMAFEPGHPFLKKALALYEGLSFLLPDGSPNLTTTVRYITGLLEESGLKPAPGILECEGIKIYPKEYFCPRSPESPRLHLTANTVSIHHYDGSWLKPTLFSRLRALAIRCFGRSFYEGLRAWKRSLFKQSGA